MFYDVYIDLCHSKGKSPSAVAQELGINKSNVSNWKNNGYTPRGSVLNKIAEYFGVTTDFLLTGNEKAPTPEGERKISDDDIMFALWGDSDDVDKDDLEDVKRYAAFVRERKKQT